MLALDIVAVWHEALGGVRRFAMVDFYYGDEYIAQAMMDMTGKAQFFFWAG